MRHPKTRAARIALRAEYGKEVDFFGRTESESRFKPRFENRVYCLGSRKEKLQFETEAKAERYIEFNRDTIADINGYAPSRAYYCTDCCCWHVTSKPKRNFR